MADEGYLCKACARTFGTRYELDNHVHRPGEILAADDPVYVGESRQPTISAAMGTEPGVMRYEKFPGKIGYRRKESFRDDR